MADVFPIKEIVEQTNWDKRIRNVNFQNQTQTEPDGSLVFTWKFLYCMIAGISPKPAFRASNSRRCSEYTAKYIEVPREAGGDHQEMVAVPPAPRVVLYSPVRNEKL
jgi:hypothetical protein